MDRIEFKRIAQVKGLYECHTSGSTGTPVTVQKYAAQRALYLEHTKYLFDQHNLSLSSKILKLHPTHKTIKVKNNTVTHNQSLKGNFDILISMPELFPLDLFQYKNIISYGSPWIGVGIDVYSSEEFGYIAIQCPSNPYCLHIMSNIEIKFSKTKGLIITDLSHPYLRDYEIGDFASPIECSCGSSLKAISHVKGRIRNMLLLPSGKLIWPTFGLRKFTSIDRYQVFQVSLTKLRLHIKGTFKPVMLDIMRESLGYDFEIEVVTDGFLPGKWEEFIREI